MVILVLSRYRFIVIPYHFPHGHYIEKILITTPDGMGSHHSYKIAKSYYFHITPW